VAVVQKLAIINISVYSYLIATNLNQNVKRLIHCRLDVPVDTLISQGEIH